MEIRVVEDNTRGAKGEEVKITYSAQGVVGCELGVEELGVGSRRKTTGDLMDCGEMAIEEAMRRARLDWEVSDSVSYVCRSLKSHTSFEKNRRCVIHVYRM